MKKRWRFYWRITFAFIALMVCLFVFGSGGMLYLSHQRFPALASLQWNWKAGFDQRRDRPLIVGHRGSGLPSTSEDATSESKLIGNTRNAIRTAIAAKVDWIEIDVRLSKDRKLVVFHDATLDAKTSHNKSVDNWTLEELKLVDVLVNPPEKILTLEEVLAEFNEHRRWILDIKVDGISDDIVLLLEQNGFQTEEIILFGDHQVLKKYEGKGYRLGYTTLFGKHRGMFFSMTDVWERCRKYSYDFLVVPVVFVTPGLVDKARERGLEVWCYDTNDARDLHYCAECGITGLIVDDPEAVIAQFQVWETSP